MKGIRFIDIDRVSDAFPDAPQRSFAFPKGLAPRVVQYARKKGVTGLLFPDPEADPGEDLPRLCIVQDIDGSKVLCCRGTEKVAKTQKDLANAFRALREDAKHADLPFALFYEEALVGEEGLAFLKGLADADDAACFAEPDEFFQEILEAMVDLPTVRLDLHKKYDLTPGIDDDLPRISEEGPLTFLPAENILTGPYLTYTLDAPNVRPLSDTGIQLTEGKTLLALAETQGKETDCGVVCRDQDFSFRVLFQPYELRVFSVDTATGTVTETDLSDRDLN